MTEKKLDEILFIVKGLSADQKRLFEMLSPQSQETIVKELIETKTAVVESIQGTVSLVTEKAVKIIVGDKYAWIPKKCIANLDKIVLEVGSIPEIELVGWFQSKIEWKRFD